MSVVVHRSGDWLVECLPRDGGRIGRLCYRGRDLLTTAPAAFMPPKSDYGAYETRPVYGYDDCLPSVDRCRYPDRDWEVPDHGELCWLPWDVVSEGSQLVCTTTSRQMPLRFERTLTFDGGALTWTFTAKNEGETMLPLQHVMHPLMPLNRVTDMRLPGFSSCVDETGLSKDSGFVTSAEITAHLLRSPAGLARMWLLQDTSAGEFTVVLDDALSVCVRYDCARFPTLGIWWNRAGYPDEDGCRRCECACEPISGPDSNLAHAQAAGTALCIKGRTEETWSVEWEVSCR